MTVQPADIAEPSTPDGSATTGEVEFRRSGVRLRWAADSHSLLDLAEAAGLEPDFSCRAGVCGTCSTRLLSGEVEYFDDPLDDPPDGEILLCCSRPRGPVVLDL